MRHVAAYIIISYIHIYLYHLHIILLLFQLLSFTLLATGKVVQFQTFASIQLQPVFDHHYNISNRKLSLSQLKVSPIEMYFILINSTYTF